MKKRVLSLFMALIMCLSLVPTAVWAETADGADTPGVGAAVENGVADGQKPDENVEDPSNLNEKDGNAPAGEADTQNAANGITVQAVGDPVASVIIDGTTRTFSTLTDAIAAANGADISLLDLSGAGYGFGENVVVADGTTANIILGDGGYWRAMDNGSPLTMNGGTVTLKSGKLWQGHSGSDARAAIALNGGELTIAGSVTEIAGGKATSASQRFAIDATGGTLDLQGNTWLDGGLGLSGDAELKNKLTTGIFTNGGPNTASVSVAGSSKYSSVFELLEPGYVFAKYDTGNGTTGEVITAGSVSNTAELTEFDVAVIKCTHASGLENGACSVCGFACQHPNGFTDGKCKDCGQACSHTNVDDTTGKCETCAAQLAAKVAANGTTSYYTTFADAIKAANAATGSVQVTALKNEHLPSGISMSGANSITLDLNGHTLDGQAITVGATDIRGNPTGAGQLTVIDSSNGNGRIGLTARGNGKLVFNPGNKSTTLSQLQVYSNADVKLYGGRILGQDKSDLTLGENIKMTDLLPEGYVFGLHLGSSGSPKAFISYDKAAKNDMSEWKSAYDLVPEKCEHAGSGADGNCPYCGGSLAATVTTAGKTTGYVSFTDALAAANAASGSTLTLLADVSDTLAVKSNITMTLIASGHPVGGNVTVQKGANLTTTGTTFNGKVNCVGTASFTGCVFGNALSASGSVTLDSCNLNDASVTVNNGGSLTVNKGGSLKDAVVNNGGKLDFQNGSVSGTIEAKSGSTVTVSGGSIATLTVRDNVTLTLSGGHFTNNITVDGEKRLIDCLAEKRAFKDSNGIVDGRTSILSNVTVVEHARHTMTAGPDGKYVCACGYECGHEKFTNGVCDACGYTCPHKDVDETTYLCNDCKARMAVKVKNGETTTYYAQSFESGGGVTVDKTLKDVFDAAPTGSTVTLLMDDLWATAYVQGGKTIKLDLNGKRLIETANGICTYNDNQDNKLIVTGTGSSVENKSLSMNRTFAVYGGTMEFEEMSFGGTFNEIYVGNGTLISPRKKLDAIHIGTLQIGDSNAKISFKAAAFDKIIFSGTSGSVKLGDLLGFWKDSSGNTIRSGNAFRYTTGDKAFVRYDTVIDTAHPIENVAISTCYHDSLGAENTCNYCGWKHLVAIYITDSGVVGTLTPATEWTEDAINIAVNTAFNTWNNMGGTLRLFAGATLQDRTITNRYATHIDLNGNTFTGGTLTLDKNSRGDGVNVTVTDSSENKNGAFANVTVNSGATLVVDGVKMGDVTLHQGCIFTDQGGFYGSITAVDGKLRDYLPEGHAFADADGNVKDSRAATLKNVKIVPHTEHSYAWDSSTHELVCGCGLVKTTDSDLPTFGGIADGETYYQNTLTFTVTDATSGVKEVKDGDSVLTADEGGNYTITADNRAHTITATDNAGNTTTVTITVYRVYNVTLPSGTGYTVTGPDTVNHGDEYVFTVRINDGYSRVPGRYKVTANGIELQSMSGDNSYDQYWRPDVTGDLTIAVEGIADITAPDTEIKIGESSFKTFLNTFTFGLFFKKTQTVTVSAADAGSGVDQVEYLLSIGALDKDNLPANGWKSIRLHNGTGSFSIEPNTKGSVYVRATDKDGNTTVINSDGVVVYTDSTAVTESISFTRLSDEDVSFKVNFNGNLFDRLLISDGKTTSSIFGSVNSNGTITLKNEELRKLAVGEYTVTVVYRPMGENYEEAEGNEAPATTTVKLTVLRATRTLTFSAPDAVYDGAAYDNLRITTPGLPEATTVKYKVKGAADSTYTETAPKDAGSYTVQITVPQDADYDAGTFTADFTISPREVTLTGGISAESRVYEKDNTAVTLTKGSLTFTELAEGETLDVTLSGGTIGSADAGENKPVTYTAALADGTGKASNYKLVGSLPTVTATIQKASAPTLTDVARSQKYHITTACTASVAGTGMPADAGALTYTAGTPSVKGAATASFTVDENGLVTYTITGGAAGDTITLPVTIGSVNYADATVNVVITLEDKDPQPDFAFAQTALTKTYGDAAFTVTATGNVTGSSVSYTSSDTSVATVNSATGEVTITGAGIAAITATASETADHRVATTTYALTVDPKTLTRNDLTHSGPITKVYDTTSNAPTDLSVFVKSEALVNGDTLPITGTLVYNSANVNEANTITFTPNAVTTGNYRLAESEVLTITGAKITPAPHNCANPTGLTAKYGQKLSDVTLTNPEGNLPGTWRWQNPGTVLDQVGTRNYSANFKPESPNYQEVKNAEIAVAVGKADAPTLANTSKSQKYTVTSGKVTVNTAGMPADAGTLTYTAGTPSVKGAATASFTVDENGLVTYTITGGAAGDTITLPVTIGSVNYADATANVVITLLPRDDQEALTIVGGDTVVYGQTLTFSATGGSGSGKVTYSVTSGTGEAAIDADTGVLTPVKVGTVKVKATKAADMDFNEVTSNEIEVTITPATPTGEPKYTKITSPGKTLADADLTVTDSTLNPNAGTLEWLDDEGNVLPDDTKVKANKTYTWRFTPDDTNYTILTGSIELYHKSRGGGGSSGDNTTTAADGSEVLSPNTGDAGLLAYGVMALSGCAGTALLLRRHKRED